MCPSGVSTSSGVGIGISLMLFKMLQGRGTVENTSANIRDGIMGDV